MKCATPSAASTAISSPQATKTSCASKRKSFHVSPFIDMDATYRFRLTRPGERLTLSIRESDAEGPLLDAVFAGKAEAVSDHALLAAFFRYPLMTLKVIVAIHFEAAKLFVRACALDPASRRTTP